MLLASTVAVEWKTTAGEAGLPNGCANIVVMSGSYSVESGSTQRNGLEKRNSGKRNIVVLSIGGDANEEASHRTIETYRLLLPRFQ